LAILILAVAGCGSGGGAAGLPVTPDPEENGNGAAPDVPPPEFVAVNDGSQELAERMGGSTFTGQATGSLESGVLTLTFSADGVLTTLGGTLLGAFFGFPAGSEVFFDYQSETVTGTYVGSDLSSQPLEDFLAGAGQSIRLTKIVVVLVGYSFSARTEYQSSVPGQPGGTQVIEFEATPRFPDDDALQGAIGLPNRTDNQDPMFTLQRQ
jgi:hypothetical protein